MSAVTEKRTVAQMTGTVCLAAIVLSGVPLAAGETVVRRTSTGQSYVVRFDGNVEEEAEEPGVRVAQAESPLPPPPPEGSGAPAAAPTPTAAPQPARRPTPRPADNAEIRARAARTRIARSPEMFGDQFVAVPLTVDGPPAGQSPAQEFTTITAPVSVNAFSQKVSENNHPLPRDRVFYTFNYYDDALQFDTALDGFFERTSQSQSLLKHTLGVEKTFNDGDSSIEIRLPFNTGTDYSRVSQPGPNVFGFDGGTVGNILVTGKTLIYEGPQFLMSTGMGVMAPTGDDSTTRLNTLLLEVQNEAVYLSPFVGTMWTPNEEWFVMTFGQIQFTANGDPVTIRDNVEEINETAGKLNAPHVLSFDLSVGRWLFRDRDGLVQGMAVIGEFHQFTALQDTDSLSGSTALGPRPGTAERLYLTTFTLGVHNQLAGNSTLRIAGVLPVDDNFFDGELVVQFNYFY